VFERLTTFIIMEDVVLDDVTDSLARIAVHGPRAFEVLLKVVSLAAPLPEHASVSASFGDHDVIVAGSHDLGVSGYDLYVDASAKADLIAALHAAGATTIDDEAWLTLRLEAGRPAFGVDMTTDTIPLEAGIEDRAISFTKGCYVGQEIIIRVMHRGHGRVARKLVGLSASDSIASGATIHAGDREIGRVTSAAYSPALDRWIGMGYVQRDFVEPGTAVSLGAPHGEAGPRTPATVVALPHSSPAPA
jgi:folate-binding protein YgfZ